MAILTSRGPTSVGRSISRIDSSPLRSSTRASINRQNIGGYVSFDAAPFRTRQRTVKFNLLSLFHNSPFLWVLRFFAVGTSTRTTVYGLRGRHARRNRE